MEYIIALLTHAATFYIGYYYHKRFNTGKVDIICDKIVGDGHNPIIKMKGNVFVSFSGVLHQSEAMRIDSKGRLIDERFSPPIIHTELLIDINK